MQMCKDDYLRKSIGDQTQTDDIYKSLENHNIKKLANNCNESKNE